MNLNVLIWNLRGLEHPPKIRILKIATFWEGFRMSSGHDGLAIAVWCWGEMVFTNVREGD